MELTSHAPCCYTALDLLLTKFSKSAVFICPTVHFIMACLRCAPSGIGGRISSSTRRATPSCSFNASGEKGTVSIRFRNKTRCFLCQSPLQEASGESVVIICLVFGCNYQPHTITRPLLRSSYIVSLLCFAFLICFFVPLSVFWFQRIEEEQAWLSRLR